MLCCVDCVPLSFAVGPERAIWPMDEEVALFDVAVLTVVHPVRQVGGAAEVRAEALAGTFSDHSCQFLRHVHDLPKHAFVVVDWAAATVLGKRGEGNQAEYRCCCLQEWQVTSDCSRYTAAQVSTPNSVSSRSSVLSDINNSLCCRLSSAKLSEKPLAGSAICP